VVAGSGGRGASSFRREKYVPAGGPDGGDGGKGGDVVIVADSSDTTLTSFRDKRRFVAANGRPGEGGRRSGAEGESVVLHVPPGTVVTEGATRVADLDREGAHIVVARGGRGGRGNARFKSATRQAPRVHELGERGEERRLRLELKLIADIGIVGLPNAGKSTLLAALTGARPKIAAYAFTTLHPNLGVAELGSGAVVVLADVPGLIEGAHHGAGLGLEFLRHVERTRALIHVVDASQGVEGAIAAVATIENELRSFNAALSERPRLLAFNKIDVPEAAMVALALQDEWPDAQLISAATGEGTQALLARAAALAARHIAAVQPDDADGAHDGHRVYRHQSKRTPPVVTREGDVFRVSGRDIERMVDITDLDNDEAVARLQRRLRAVGVDAALAGAGCTEGDTVRIGGSEFTYTDSEIRR
jgi:GTPase